MQPLTIVWVPRALGIKNKVIFKISKAIDATGADYSKLVESWKEISNQNIEEINELFNELSVVNSNYRSYDLKLEKQQELIDNYIQHTK